MCWIDLHNIQTCIVLSRSRVLEAMFKETQLTETFLLITDITCIQDETQQICSLCSVQLSNYI